MLTRSNRKTRREDDPPPVEDAERDQEVLDMLERWKNEALFKADFEASDDE